jgi:putative transposase
VTEGQSRNRQAPVAEALRRVATRCMPAILRSDNGSEFASYRILRGAPIATSRLISSSLGKPMHNAEIESLNGRIRDELINPHLFRLLEEVRDAAESWRIDYSEVRPHSGLGYLTPREFANRFEFTPRRRFTPR